MRELRPIGPRGLTPPPFLQKKSSRRPGRRRRGWWAGLNRRSKLCTCLSALLVATLLTALIVSSAVGDSRETPRRAVPRMGAVALAEQSVGAGASLVKLAVLSLRIRGLTSEFKELAPTVHSELSELSRVVQGAKCSGYIACALQLRDAGVPEPLLAGGRVPDDPRGAWNYANALSDSYMPMFCELLARFIALKAWASPSARHLPAAGPAHLLLGCCDLQAQAIGRYVRALELVRDCDENTVGQACELASEGDRLLEEARARLDKADRTLGAPGQDARGARR